MNWVEEEQEKPVETVGDELDPLKEINALTYALIGAAQKVHGQLGPGFSEAVYHNGLCKELMLRKIPFESQREFTVAYEGMICGTFRPDLTVEDSVIVELKAVADLNNEHVAQTVSYLKASGLTGALLLNFGTRSLQVRRLKR
jgi:GxxExxY protein